MTSAKIGNIGYYIAVQLRPETVVLNEVCIGQASAIEQNLSARGYPMYLSFGSNHIANTGPSACQYNTNGAGYYGNAIFTRSPHNGVNNTTLYGTESEKRGVLCVTTQINARSTRVCGTHLSAGSSSDRLEQTRQVADYTYSIAQTAPIIVAGDFNSTPGNSDINQMYSYPGYATEVDRADNEPTSPLSSVRKIDYVFHRYVTLSSSSGVVVTPGEPYPGAYDHRILYGNMSAN